MRTNDFTVTFTDCGDSRPSLTVTVHNVPTLPTAYPHPYGHQWVDQEALARYIATKATVHVDRPTYGIHAQRIYRQH